MFDDLQKLIELAKENNELQAKQLDMLVGVHKELREIKVRLTEINK